MDREDVYFHANCNQAEVNLNVESEILHEQHESHVGVRSALKVPLECAKCTLAAPAQKAQLFSTRVACEGDFIFGYCYLSKSSTWGKGPHSYLQLTSKAVERPTASLKQAA